MKRSTPLRRKTRLRSHKAGEPPKPLRAKGRRRFKGTEDRAHLVFVRSLPCLACVAAKATRPCGRVDPHHVKTKATGGHDRQTVPLGRGHHDELHTTGRRTFERKYGLDLAAEAARLAALNPDLRGAA